MNGEKTQGSFEEESEGALAALKRARQRAEELAARTGTDLIQAVDGKPVRIAPPQRTKDTAKP
jgi:hypothetical protein